MSRRIPQAVWRDKRVGRMIAVGGWAIAMLLAAAAAAHAESPHSAAMTARVDALIEKRLAAEGVAPAPLADDAEFLRRVSLDLTGVIPRVAEARAFLDDPSPEKRARLIDDLLQSPRHATHLANTWRQIMLPGGFDLEQLASVSGVQNWLRRQFAANLRYDRLVSDFLVAGGGGDNGPALFYTSMDLDPAKLAASTSRIFLGLQIECAECHPHPFDRWTQDDFWGYAAFFARLDQSAMGMNQIALVDRSEGEVTLPDSETVVAPKFPAGRQPNEVDGGTRRVQLAIWMASRDNPFLAHAAVNRVWSLLFGRGLVEPVDDLGPHNPASHPELLDALADYFVASGFDVRELLKVLANTEAYQRTSRAQPSAGAHRPELFAAMPVKTLSAEQLYDCLQRVWNQTSDDAALVPGGRGSLDPRRLAFASKMHMRGANATEFEAGVLQALTLLNGSETARLTDPQSSGLLRGISAPWMNDTQRLEALYLATLTRYPSEEEHEFFAPHIRDAQDEGKVWSDILWALVNHAEFCLNH